MPFNVTRRDVLFVFLGLLVASIIAAVLVLVFVGRPPFMPLPSSIGVDTAEMNPDQQANLERKPGIWSPALFEPPPNLQEVIDLTQESLVEIWCGEGASGTGWLLSTDLDPVVRIGQEPAGGEPYDGIAVTAWHVVEDCISGDGDLEVFRGQRLIPAIVLNWHRKHDIAVLSVQTSRPGLKVEPEAPLGTWAMTAGFPLTDKPTPVFGYMIGKDELEIYSQMPIRPGHSGSPLVNSLGEAVGIVTSVPLDPESEASFGWTISTSVVALCEKLFSCPAGDIEGLTRS